MDAGLAWTVVGSAAAVAALPLAAVPVWQSRRRAATTAAGVSGELPGGSRVTVSGSQGAQFGGGNIQVNNFAAPPVAPSQPAGLVVGQVPRQPPGWQPRPGLLAAVQNPGPGSRVVVAAVTGMRGVGKTQLAAAVARTRLGEPGWRFVAWVDAETPDGLLAGLTDTAEALGLPAAGDAAAGGFAVRRWLEADGAGYLLVLDNVTDPDLVAPFLPAAGKAQVIITTTRRDAPGLGRMVDVEVFTEAEGLAYLAGQTGLADESGARVLGEEFGWLPLALAQAAAVITGQRLGYADYLGRLRAVPVAELLAPVPAGQYPRGAAEAILLSLDAVTAADRSGACRRVMDLLAVLSPGGVPRALISASPQDSGPDSATDAALGRLAAASLLSFGNDGSAVITHRLVQRAVRDQLTSSGHLAAACHAAAEAAKARALILADAPDLDRSAARDLAGQIAALQQAAAHASGGGQLDRAITDAWAWSLYFLNELGDSPTQTIETGEGLTAEFERTLGPDHPDTMASRYNLAIGYQAAGRTAEAIILHETTLAARQRILGPTHPHTLASRNGLAIAYRAAGRTAEAITLGKATLAAYEHALGPGHRDTMASRHNLARCYQAAGRTAEAIPLHETTLAEMKRALGADHPDTLTAAHILEAARQAAKPRRA